MAGFRPSGAGCFLFLSACGLGGCYIICNLCYHRLGHIFFLALRRLNPLSANFKIGGARLYLFLSAGGLIGCTLICLLCYCNLKAAIVGLVAVLVFQRLDSLAAGFGLLGAQHLGFLKIGGLFGSGQ